MPRIRSIKPEFWTSAQVLECSPNARLLFIGLWNFADDEGRHPDNPKQAKAEVFPADDFSLEDVQGMLQELSKNGLITRYTVEGKGFFQITGWHHQRIDKPQPAKYPGPVEDHSKNDPGTLPPDRKGKDRKGKDKDIGATDDAPADFAREFDEEIKPLYPNRLGSQEWAKAKRGYVSRRKRGGGFDEIRAGTVRYARFCSATGKSGTEFVKQAGTFFSSAEEHWKQPWSIPEARCEEGVFRGAI
jgi:hypothetical protein